MDCPEQCSGQQRRNDADDLGQSVEKLDDGRVQIRDGFLLVGWDGDHQTDVQRRDEEIAREGQSSVVASVGGAPSIATRDQQDRSPEWSEDEHRDHAEEGVAGGDQRRGPECREEPDDQSEREEQGQQQAEQSGDDHVRTEQERVTGAEALGERPHESARGRPVTLARRRGVAHRPWVGLPRS